MANEKYTGVIFYHDKNGDDDSHIVASDDLQECVDGLNSILANMSFAFCCPVFINNTRIKVGDNSKLAANDGSAICTNPAFHETFAPANYPRIYEATNINTLKTLGVL